MILFRSEHVLYMPKDLQVGVLYVSEEFETAAHLCACGCGSKIRTPLGPTEWKVTESKQGPTLYPSVGNWQQECQSHYWIEDGKVRWAPKWTPEEIAYGRQREHERRVAYFDGREQKSQGRIQKLWSWIKTLFS